MKSRDSIIGVVIGFFLSILLLNIAPIVYNIGILTYQVGSFSNTNAILINVTSQIKAAKIKPPEPQPQVSK